MTAVEQLARCPSDYRRPISAPGRRGSEQLEAQQLLLPDLDHLLQLLAARVQVVPFFLGFAATLHLAEEHPLGEAAELVAQGLDLLLQAADRGRGLHPFPGDDVLQRLVATHEEILLQAPDVLVLLPPLLRCHWATGVWAAG